MEIININQLKYTHKNIGDYIAVCKKTSYGFIDYKNKSGALTKYLKTNNIINNEINKIVVSDYFYILNSNIIINNNEEEIINCPYCNKKFKGNKSGMFTNHLIKKHNTNINDFIKENKDYKKHFLSYLKNLRIEGEHNCKICNKNFKSNNSLCKHISRTHNIKTNDYFHKYYYNEINYCKCGCGEPVKFSYSSNHINKERKYFPDYIAGHEQHNKQSNNEISIINYIKSLGLQDNEIILRNRKLLNGLELDIYLPKYNLAIEYCGSFWHSEKMGKDKDYHINKKNKCKDLDIELITIWDVDYNKNSELIHSIIRNKLINNDFEKIYARKCIVKEISNSEYLNFCNNNHLQGYVQAKIKLGLFYNNELISLMSFNNLRKFINKNNNNKNYYELVRYCLKPDLKVFGGANKLLKYFERKYKPEKLISYCNLDYFNGNTYINLGMNKVNYSHSYFYLYGNKKINRYSLTKHKLIDRGYDKNLTANEIIKSINIIKVWNCGNYKYEKYYI